MPKVTIVPMIGTIRTQGFVFGTSSSSAPKTSGTNGKTSISCMSMRPRCRAGVHRQNDEVEQERSAHGDRQAVAPQITALPAAREVPEGRRSAGKRPRHACDGARIENAGARVGDSIRGCFNQPVIHGVEIVRVQE